MPAHRAYAFIHHRLVRKLNEDQRLEVDAILGDDAAAAEMQVRRTAAAELMEADFG